MSIVKKIGASTKDFVVKHRGKIAFAAGATVGIALNVRSVALYDAFLKEHDLFTEFYFGKE